MASTTFALSARGLTEEEMLRLRHVCDEQGFSYGVFCSLIVKDVLNSEETLAHYVQRTRQFEEDQRPASIEELKALREKLRQQEAELEELRQLKHAMHNHADTPRTLVQVG